MLILVLLLRTVFQVLDVFTCIPHPEFLSADDLALDNNISIYKSSIDNLRIVGVQNGTAKLQMFNILGKTVLKTSFEGNGVNDINLNNIPVGIYIVKLATENGTINRKIIIQY